MTATLEPIAEEEVDTMDFVELYEKLVLASEVTLGLLAGAEPNAHQFYVTIFFNG